MSGAWLSIIQGFAGMRTNNQTLSFNPKLPNKWNSYSFNINYRENKLKIEVNKDKFIIKIRNSLKYVCLFYKARSKYFVP